VAELIVVDTDLLIDYLRGRSPGRELVRGLLLDGRLRVTAITAFELRVGGDFLPRRGEILRLVRRRTLPLDQTSALRAGEVAAGLRGQGRDIGLADCLQAGICLRHELQFATRNRRHFERVQGLRLVELGAALS
jgi:tRNA(fMet)-specific endonuclease VapC